jgi:hypothetical protein
MVNKKFYLGILVMALVFGMTVVGNLEAQSNSGGTFTLTDIPAKYNGKYVLLSAEPDENFPLLLVGASSIYPLKLPRIINGKVIIPLWYTRDGNCGDFPFKLDPKKFERYSGNHSKVFIIISIHDDEKSEEELASIWFSEDRRYDNRIKFSNGNVTRSITDGDLR